MSLQQLAKDTGEPMSKVLARAVTDYRRKVFWEESRKAMERLKADPAAYAEYKAEGEMWELASLEDFEKSVPPYFDADHPR